MMNERIQELAETAGWKKTRWGGGEGWCGDPNVSLEVFAELIVEECASKVTRNEALNIFEHFGVEQCISHKN